MSVTNDILDSLRQTTWRIETPISRRLYDALIRLDECSKMLGHTLQMSRIGWDEINGERSDVLEPINQIAFQIGDAIKEAMEAYREA